jgi:hypothetical protein
MITKYFCDCGKELIFTKESETIFCECGRKYSKGFCPECMTFGVDQMYVPPKETIQQHLER